MPGPELRILFITAEPEDQIRPNNTLELQVIQEALKASGAAFEAQYVFRGTRKRVVRELKSDPHIVHFLCHGETGGLFLEDDDAGSNLIDADWLIDVFAGSPSLRVVFLNACNSAALARAIVASESGCSDEVAAQLVRLAQALRRLTEQDLEETASTRLLVMAARLHVAGLALLPACRAAIVDALTDEADTGAALHEVLRAVIGDA